jgi:Putative adhesin
MRAVAARGRWIWGVSGLVTTAALIVSGTYLITSAGRAEHEQPARTATRTVTVPQPVTSLTVQSYGDPVQVTAGPVRRVEVTETLNYDPQEGGPPAVAQSVSGGHLSLGDPACANSDCDVSFSVTVPSDVTATVTTEGGPVTVSGVAGANLDSGSGPVRATGIGGPLTVITGGGPLQLDGLAGTLSADTGGGPLTAQGVAARTATITTGGGDAQLAFSAPPDTVTVNTEGGSLTLDGPAGILSADTGGGPLTVQGVAATTATITTGGGDARLAFATDPDTVTVSTDGGSAQLAVPGGPYALNADSGGGPQSVGIATDPAAARSITVISDGGPLWIGQADRLPARPASFGELTPMPRRIS